MIRATTPLPKPPSAERDSPEVLDAMLCAVQGCGPLASTEIVAFTRALLPSAIPHDIRMLLKRPYFRLTDSGWVSCWQLPLPRNGNQATIRS